MEDATPAQEFARALRELKERSGLSFGALSTRLHTSTSTLHRYCSGAALPQEYATADRLAALCGATEPERRHLHRLWVLADAQRGVTPAKPAPGPQAEPTAVPSDVPPAEPTAEPTAAPGPARPWWRRPPTVRLTVGLAALLLTAALTLDAAGGAKAGTAGEDAAPLEWTTRSHVWAFGCGHRYLVDAEPQDVPAPPVAQDAERWSAARRAVHAEAAIVEITLTAEPGTGAPVVVEAAHIRIAERRAPLPWPVYRMDNGCGGSLAPAAFGVDLDADRPLAHPVAGGDAATGEEFPAPRLPFALGADEPLLLRFEARAATGDVDWYIELDWNSGGVSGTTRIDDDGRPFRTSGTTGPVLVHDIPTGRWLPE